jgi:hypothetical protein
MVSSIFNQVKELDGYRIIQMRDTPAFFRRVTALPPKVKAKLLVVMDGAAPWPSQDFLRQGFSIVLTTPADRETSEKFIAAIRERLEDQRLMSLLVPPPVDEEMARQVAAETAKNDRTPEEIQAFLADFYNGGYNPN